MRSEQVRLSIAAAAMAVLGIGALSSPIVRAQKLETSGARAEQRFYPDDPIWRDADMRDIPPVARFELSKSYDFLLHTFGSPPLSAGPALNVNTLGEVPDSSWFTNRLGRHDMTVSEVVKGPDRVDGPAAGAWLVTGRPDAGITPKFTIRDSRGDVYLIKLDPARFPELPSSVELISTKIFHAIGYHVPEDFIVRFTLSQLTAAPGATMRTPTGDRRPIRPSDIERWLADQPRGADGTIRALASRYVPGKVVGEFQYFGTRPDDPNDIYPHERRRELRGLRVFAAWLNHDDARALNSIDAYVEEDGRRYVRHYLQDFGSNLGSGSTSAQQPRGGYEYLIEGPQILKGLAGLGLWTRGWMTVKYPRSPTLGNVEADFFEPSKWKTEYPQPAFNQMDAADAFWAAGIVSRFSDPMIRSIVEVGQLSSADASRLLADIIIKRRDKVVAYWLTRTNPLDRFDVQTVQATGSRELTFDNAAIRVRAAAAGAKYRIQWAALDNVGGGVGAVGGEVDVTEPRVSLPAAGWGGRDAAGFRYAVASIRTIHPDYPWWASPVVVTLRDRGGAVDVVGIERPVSGALRRAPTSAIVAAHR